MPETNITLETTAFPVSPGQFSTVHAMRGFAALWVVLFHAFKFRALAGSSLEDWPNFTRIIFEYGRGGVAVFFVISGFVISHSLRDARPDLRFVGIFMARRSIRLDPPYWGSILIALGVGALAANLNGLSFDLPSAGMAVAHLAYLQELLRLPEIMVVYWTLTYEIQFYLVFVLALWWRHAWLSRSGNRLIANSLPLALCIAAFAAAAQSHEWVLHGLFLNYWHAFAAGCFAYAGGIRRNDGAAILLLPLAALMLFSAPATVEVFNSPAALTALFLLAAGRARALSHGLNARPLQFLGTVSYSLYLLHVPVILVMTSVFTRLLGRSETTSPMIFMGVIGSCIAAAAVYWRVVERPTHRLAKRFGSPRPVPPQPAPPKEIPCAFPSSLPPT